MPVAVAVAVAVAVPVALAAAFEPILIPNRVPAVTNVTNARESERWALCLFFLVDLGSGDLLE